MMSKPEELLEVDVVVVLVVDVEVTVDEVVGVMLLEEEVTLELEDGPGEEAR